MINHITKIYNKDFFEKNTQVTVNEPDKKATINNITFINADEFIKIDVEFLQTIDNALSSNQLCYNFTKCQELTLRQIADGIFLAKIKNKWILGVCELKSTLNSYNFIKAKAQLETTVFKTKLFLKVIEALKIENVISFIVADIPKKPEDLIENVRNRNQKNKSRIQKEYQKILQEKKIKVKKDICILKNTKIQPELLLTNTFLYFIEGNNKKIDIREYLN